jgi:uncharacterized delta-60 repeat protein
MRNFIACAFSSAVALGCSSGGNSAPVTDAGSGTTDASPDAPMQDRPSTQGDGGTVGAGSVLDAFGTNDELVGTLHPPNLLLLALQNEVTRLGAGDAIQPLVTGTLPSLDAKNDLLYVDWQQGAPANVCRAALPAGTPDATFGSGGCVAPPAQTYADPPLGVRALPGVGVLLMLNPNCINGCAPGQDSFEMFRVTSAGQPDATFGTNGLLHSAIASGLQALSFDVQSTGKVVVSATATFDLKLFRLLPNGALDTTFATAGFVPSPGAGDFLEVMADDSFVLVSSYNGMIDVERYSKDGAPDATFGSGGRADLTVLPHNQDDAFYIAGAHVDAAGRVYVAGAIDVHGSGSTYSPFVVRVLANGSLDPAFGQAGFVTTFGAGDTLPTGIGEDADGKVLVGFRRYVENDMKNVVRLEP